jgi:hypothetical protein
MTENTKELFDRWVSIIRYKAATYEHEARAQSKEVSFPDLDTICNEMRAFQIGLEKK